MPDISPRFPLEFVRPTADTHLKDATGERDSMGNDINLAPRILIAVADPDVRRHGVAALRSAGFCVSAPTDGEAAMLLAESFAPDVLVIDADVRTPNGRPLYEQLREHNEHYLLCVTDDRNGHSRAALLRAGADDAISLPVSADELAARCSAMLRRPRQLQQRVDGNGTAGTLSLGPLSIDLGRREVRVDDTEVPTTRIEFSLLEQLCRRPTEVCTREDLLDAVWGPQWVGDHHVVDVHLSNLRRKLDKAAPGVKVIHTVRGVGFRLANDVTDSLDMSPVFGLATAI